MNGNNLTADAPILEILKWAVDPQRPVPELEAVDADALMDLTGYHRIVGRMLARLDAARPAWCPPRLRTRLRIRQHEIVKHTRQRMEAAQEISRAMRARGLAPPIFVKGFAAHALTDDPAHLHFSGDLDPFAEDLPAFWDVLHGLGYTGKRKDTHEWAKLGRGGVSLDVHQYYPVLAYPTGMRTAPAEELEAGHNPGHWALPLQASDLVPSGERVRWADLAAGATPGVAEGTEGLLFPSPTLMCLIHCAHCFRSSVTRLHYMNPLGGFRLYELLSVFALARLPSFDAAQFAALVERFSAHDAVRLMDTLSEAFLGASALPGPGTAARPASAPVFPEHLIYGGWAALQKTDDWLRMRGIEEMFDQLDANVVPTDCVLDVADVPRLLTYGRTAGLPSRLGVTWDAPSGALAVAWEWDDAPPSEAGYELLAHFGYDSFARVDLGTDGAVEAVTEKSDFLRPDRPRATATVIGADRRAVQLSCSVPSAPRRPASSGTASLPLLVAARRLSPDGHTDAAVYLPLRVKG